MTDRLYVRVKFVWSNKYLVGRVRDLQGSSYRSKLLQLTWHYHHFYCFIAFLGRNKWTFHDGKDCRAQMQDCLFIYAMLNIVYIKYHFVKWSENPLRLLTLLCNQSVPKSNWSWKGKANKMRFRFPAEKNTRKGSNMKRSL